MPNITWEGALVVGAGGALGAVARYLVSAWAAERFGTAFPWGTLLINVSGSLLLALFAAWFTRQVGLSPTLRLGFAVGFCGAYTTFSTYALDTMSFAQGGQVLAAFANFALNNALCLAAAAVGMFIGGRL